MPTILFDNILHVHYAQAYIAPEASPCFAMEDAFRGQTNGLCGAAVPGCLFLVTGLHTGGVPFRVELHPRAPDLNDWPDIVEVSFSVSRPTRLQEWAGEAVYPLQLPTGQYRVRYAANDIDAGASTDTATLGPDAYLLQFWPEPTPTPDAILRQTSQKARHFHDALPKRTP